MQPEVPYELVWDPAAEGHRGRSRQLLEQLQAATSGPLVPMRQRDLLTALTEDPSLVHRFRVTPAQLPSLALARGFGLHKRSMRRCRHY